MMADQIIKHRFTGATLYEFQPTDEQHASGLAMRAALEAATASRADLRDADLRGADLRDADLGGADLRDVDLGGADLRGADLRDADLRGADLRDADLRGADLGGADLRGADLRGADLGGADLRGADLGGDGKLAGDRPLLLIGPIGSRGDYLQAYLTSAGVRIRAGCFFGTRDEFVAAVAKTHGGNKHGREYRAALELITEHVALWAPEPAAEQEAQS